MKNFFIATFVASSIGLTGIVNSQPTYAQALAACPDPSTLTSVDGIGDATSFDSVTGGDCSGTPDGYGVTIYRMGLCTNNPSPSQGASPDYNSCSISFESESGNAANFAAGKSVDLDGGLAARPNNGTYRYLFILLGSTFNIKAKYGPIAGVTYYSTSTSTGWPASANTTGPATYNPVSAKSFGDNCDSEDSLTVDSGTLTGSLLNSSEIRISESAAVPSCIGVKYILGVVSLNEPVTVDNDVTSLEAVFKVTNNGTTINIDNSNGIIFDIGPFDASMRVNR